MIQIQLLKKFQCIWFIFSNHNYTNITLNFEVISWDIPSYLVASQEINMGYLPLETQWESKVPCFSMYNIISNIVNNNIFFVCKWYSVTNCHNNVV